MKGKKHTQEAKDKISKANKGRKMSEEHKEKISKANKGYKHTQEAKDKISKSREGFEHTQETRDKMSKSHKGKKHTQEAKDKIGKASRGRPKSLETLDKMSKSQKGRIVSQETRDKLSASCKGRAGRPKRVWTAEEESELEQYVLQGISITAIMKKMNRSHKQISLKLKEQGRVITGWTQEMDAKLLQLVQNETGLKDIVDILGVTTFRIKNRVKDLDDINGTDLFDRVNPGQGRYKIIWTEEQLLILNQYADNNAELVKRLPFCITTIRNKLEEIS